MTITEIIQIITLIIIAIGAIIALKQIQDQHELYRREKALSYSSLYRPEIQEIKKKLNENFNIASREGPIPKEELEVKLKENKELGNYLSTYLNYYENISLAYFYNLADEDVLFHLISGSLIDSRKKLMNYIDFRRKQAKNPELYVTLEKLSEIWEGMKEDERVRIKGPLGFKTFKKLKIIRLKKN